MDDSSLVELYFLRDEKAIQETDIKYGKACLRIAHNILGNHEDAMECVNDVYLSVWNSVPPSRPQNFSSYLYKITRNLALKRFEYIHASKRCPDFLVSLSELENILSDHAVSPEINDSEIEKIISAFLRTEKTEYRIVFIRRYYFFDSIEEIADNYSFSQSKVKSILYHMRNRLKKYLRKEGVSL